MRSESSSFPSGTSTLAFSIIFVTHTVAALYFFARLFLYIPFLPLFRNPRRLFFVLSAFPFFFLPCSFLQKLPVLLAYFLASLHLSRTSSFLQRHHAVFLFFSFLSISGIHPMCAAGSCLALLLIFNTPLEEPVAFSRVHATFPPHPTEASAAELLLFTWLGPIVTTARIRPLEDTDVAPLRDTFRSEEVGERTFDGIWAEECRHALEEGRTPSVCRALAFSFGKHLLLGSVFRLFYDTCVFVSPFVLRRIIISLQETRTNGANGKVSSSHEYGLASILLISYITQSIFFNQHHNTNAIVQAKLRGALIHAVFAKSCRLSPVARAKFSSGAIQNLMATDSMNVGEVAFNINYLWSALLQIFVALFILVGLLGWMPVLLGGIFLLLWIPVNYRLLELARDFRERASACTDDRVKSVSEALQGIKVVKLYAWELPFIERILGKRALELNFVRKSLIFSAWDYILAVGAVTMLSVIVFTSYAVTVQRLDEAVIFPAMAIFNAIRGPLLMFPYAAVICARAVASCSRLQKFLCAEELESQEDSPHRVAQDSFSQQKADVIAENSSYSWSKETDEAARPSLRNVSLCIPQGSLVCVLGGTGSGKSTLLASFLGEVPVLAGNVGIRPGCSVSFADQIPFIQNATIRDNILFGRPFYPDHYKRIIEVCCLVPDLRILPQGDLTEIGGRGVNLSGGQCSRVSLARVAYAKTDIALLDDPLSAVDAHVGRSLFNDCIVSEMKETTRIMTTNEVGYASSQYVDFIAVVRDGILAEFGARVNLLRDPSSIFYSLTIQNAGDVDEIKEKKKCRKIHHATASKTRDKKAIPRKTAAMPDDYTEENIWEVSERIPLLNTERIASESKYGSLVSKEGKSEGRVKLGQYTAYMNAAGGPRVFFLAMFLALGTMVSSIMVNFWLSIWSDRSSLDATLPPDQEYTSMILNLLVYIVLAVASIIAITAAALVVACASIKASISLHEDLLISVFGAPNFWFAKNPIGRIVNRFNSDIDKMDFTLANTMYNFTRLALNLLGALFLILYATPLSVLLVIPVGAAFLFVQEYYRKASVDLRRLEALAKSPLYSHFSEVLDGIATIRAFKEVPKQTLVSQKLSDSLNGISYASSSANRWLSTRLSVLGTILIFSSTCLAILSKGTISSSLIGLVLSYAMQLLQEMVLAVRQFTEMESQMSSIERISEFSTSPPLPLEEQGGLDATLRCLANNGATSTSLSHEFISAGRSELFGKRRKRLEKWPPRGEIEFKNVTMRYGPTLDPALNRVCLSITSGERIGIVGRTGAGKSSLLASIFRLNELESGSILIDGRDISAMSLFGLRSSLSVIPQEPCCFSGTIRSNLDMFEEFDDVRVREALAACGLEETMGYSISLDDLVQENGNNLSVGQRQLLCLGRALLRNSKVIVLDEATSSVSSDTDEKIQATLRREKEHCTMLIVAHRLHTVMTCDRIVVMDYGRIVEVGHPSELLSRDSYFSDLLNKTGSFTTMNFAKSCQ